MKTFVPVILALLAMLKLQSSVTPRIQLVCTLAVLLICLPRFHPLLLHLVPTVPSTAPTSAPSTSPVPASLAPITPIATHIVDSGIGRYMSEETFKSWFLEALPVYAYKGLLEGLNKYPAFANSPDDEVTKREIAAFFDQLAHQSGHFKYTEEIGAEKYAETQYCEKSSEKGCAAGKHYHGRGPIQLSWNYNYLACGKALGVDLWANPELVATDSSIAWGSGLWCWMNDVSGKGAIHQLFGKADGFAQSTRLINGGLECGPNSPNKDSEKSRIENYKKNCTALKVSPGQDSE